MYQSLFSILAKTVIDDLPEGGKGRFPGQDPSISLVCMTMFLTGMVGEKKSPGNRTVSRVPWHLESLDERLLNCGALLSLWLAETASDYSRKLFGCIILDLGVDVYFKIKQEGLIIIVRKLF